MEHIDDTIVRKYPDSGEDLPEAKKTKVYNELCYDFSMITV